MRCQQWPWDFVYRGAQLRRPDKRKQISYKDVGRESKSVEETMAIDPNAVPTTCHDASCANPLAELESREGRITKNLEGLDTSSKIMAIGEELTIIKEKKLYHAAGIRSFKRYLDTRRTPISRARGYQLIAFTKKRHIAALSGQPIPTTERQSRVPKADSNESTPFEQRWPWVYKYLSKKFRRWPPHERERFAETLALVAQGFMHLAQRLKKDEGDNQTPILIGGTVVPRKFFQNEPKDS
jgi:hypothetical protein